MTSINTVLGPIDTAALGFTLMHEHLLTAAAGVTQNYPELLHGGRYKERILNLLARAKEGGVDTIVDATTLDLGRDVALMAEASRLTGVNIIASTGWYMFIPRFLAGNSVDQFAQLFIREIREGIAGTGIKAGVLKAASDLLGVTPEEEKILRAVARAHLETNTPIMLHSYSPGQVAKRQLAILKEEGVNLRRVKVDHCLDTTDVEYLTWLLEQDCYLGMERLPGFVVSPLARIRTMKALIDAGYADYLLPSHDWGLVRAIDSSSEKQEERDRSNPHGLLYLKNVVFPKLREMGVSEKTLSSLCTYGPRKFFEGG